MRKYAAILALALLPLHLAAADPPPAITLAQMFPTAQPPAKGVALVVGAGKVRLPADSPPPPSGLPLAKCASDFGLITQAFGAVTAVAPASMIVFNNTPGQPDLSHALSPSDAFRQLAASLSDSQWSELASEEQAAAVRASP